jgi:pyruvate dehydrogenase E1 component
VITGGYWLETPTEGAEIAIVYSGAVAAEAVEAHRQITEDIPDAGLLAVTSADRLNAGWHAAERGRQTGHATEESQIENLLKPLAPDAALITIIDGHPLTLAWMGSVFGHRVHPLGVEHFGQSGDLPDLYRHYRLDVEAILDAVASTCLRK